MNFPISSCEIINRQHKTKQGNGEIGIEMKDNATSTHIDGSYNLKVIQTRKEYVESLLKDFGSGQISHEKLVGELTQEFKNVYSFVESLITNVTQLKNNYEFLLNIIISMPEVQNNPDLAQKITEKFPEDSHP
jgi:hypothetical protein